MNEEANSAAVEMDKANKNNDILEQVGTMKMVQLKDKLKKQKLKTSGNKSELQNRLRAVMFLEAEHREDKENKEEMDIRCEHILTFRDTEESMSVGDEMNICNWLQEIEGRTL